ncbi:MAG: FAD binding domain-containing protein [Gaiellaceae bacterium]
MREFAYSRASSVDDAVAAASARGAKFLGGGTNLVDLMRLEVETPELLVDVTHLPFCSVDETTDGGLRIGAGVRNSDLAASPLVRERYAVLSDALLAGASGQLRNAATTGGNLLQRTRCPYFQDVTKPCNKRDPGTGCPAREGEHRNLAILGWSEECVATHPSDMAVALAALDAVVETTARRIPVVDLHRLPGDEPWRDTVLDPGELIVAVDLPAAGRSRYRKVRERASYSFALVSVAVAYDLGGVRIAFGGLAHKPWRAFAAEEALQHGASFADAADVELTRAQPLRDNGFKVELAKRTLISVLEELA